MNTHLTRTLLKAVLVAGSLLVLFTAQHFGQRVTSRDDLAAASYLTTGTISDDLEGTDDEYFYKFAANPGKLTITLEVIADKTNAGAMLDLVGTKAILQNVLVQAANGGSEQVFQTVTITKKQDLIIKIKGLRYGSASGYPGTYKIALEGSAVAFNEAEVSDGAVAGETPDDAKAGTTPTGQGGKGKKPSKVDGAIDKAKKESSKWLEIVDKVKKTKP